jgi:hypothetical protein
LTGASISFQNDGSPGMASEAAQFFERPCPAMTPAAGDAEAHIHQAWTFP